MDWRWDVGIANLLSVEVCLWLFVRVWKERQLLVRALLRCEDEAQIVDTSKAGDRPWMAWDQWFLCRSLRLRTLVSFTRR